MVLLPLQPDDQHEGYAGSGIRSCLILPRLPKLAVSKAIEVGPSDVLLTGVSGTAPASDA